jgi:hypothetical protein
MQSATTGIPRHLKIGAVALVAMGIFGVALFGGFVPGLRPNYSEPTTIEVNGLSYYWTEYHFPWPLPPANTTTPTLQIFHNISFQVWVTNWYSGAGGIVNGNGTEPNGTTYGFRLGGSSLGSNESGLFISPDKFLGAAWSGQAFVELLVLASNSVAS